MKAREKIAERFDVSQNRFREYIHSTAKRSELLLFNYLPENQRADQDNVDRALAYIDGILFIEQGLHKTQILHNTKNPDKKSWHLFARRLLEQPGFEEFFEYNSDRFGHLVAELFEELTGNKYKKRPAMNIDVILTALDDM